MALTRSYHNIASRHHLIAGLLLAMISVSAPAQDKKPYWLLFEEGQALASRHEYGEALTKFKEAIAAIGALPEAEMAIGDVYMIEGEMALAIGQYQKAYNLRNVLTIPDTKYDILYRLADAYQEEQQYNLMETSLLAISADDRSFNPPKGSRLKEQVLANFYKSNLDSVLKLYRFDTDFAQGAHSRLGWFYYKTGRFDPSIEHLLYAVILVAGDAIQTSAEKDPQYQFTSLPDLLATAAGASDLTQFFTGSTIFADLYYLAGSLFQSGKPGHAMSLWRALSSSSLAGKYRDLARRQIKSPWMEPYLLIPAKPLRAQE
jgi:tetratricopeptide (TPR) repeat protein